MKTKLCRECNKNVSVLNFSKGKDNGYAYWCKNCVREYDKKRHKKQAVKRREQARSRRQELSIWFQELKNGLSCVRCGESHNSCLEFHHKDPTTKIMSLANMPKSGFSKEVILEEITKCEVLCANCHRKLHSDGH